MQVSLNKSSFNTEVVKRDLSNISDEIFYNFKFISNTECLFLPNEQNEYLIEKFKTVIAQLYSNTYLYTFEFRSEELSLCALIFGIYFRTLQISKGNLQLIQAAPDKYLNDFITDLPTQQDIAAIFKESKAPILIKNIEVVRKVVDTLCETKNNLKIAKDRVTNFKFYQFSCLAKGIVFNPDAPHYARIPSYPVKFNDMIFKDSMTSLDLAFPKFICSEWLVKSILPDFPSDVHKQIAEHFFATPDYRTVCKAARDNFNEMIIKE